MRRMATPRRGLRSLNPLRSFSALHRAGQAQDVVDRAVEAVRARRPDTPEQRSEWFGWPLAVEPRNRYAAVGFEGRGFVVDVVTGHILWERAIAGRGELPRSLSDLPS
jgi:hypothetical protein